MTRDNGFVERPKSARSLPMPAHDLEHVLATVDNGKAVRVSLNGRQRHSVQGTLRLAALRRGLRLRYIQDADPDFIIAWCERRDGS